VKPDESEVAKLQKQLSDMAGNASGIKKKNDQRKNR
jgi:hypothetical protein